MTLYVCINCNGGTDSNTFCNHCGKKVFEKEVVNNTEEAILKEFDQLTDELFGLNKLHTWKERDGLLKQFILQVISKVRESTLEEKLYKRTYYEPAATQLQKEYNLRAEGFNEACNLINKTKSNTK
jgi:DNA-directed RNA polymerase subunit RPC12/RpoP